MTSRPLGEAVGVTRRFGSLVANDDIDLLLSAGEVVGLLGANGAGKSTFMRLLLGLLSPSSGTIWLFGQPPSRETRQRIGYVPQGLGLYEDLTVAENLQFATTAYHTHATALDDAALAAHADTLVRDLSLGLRRRLAFAAALTHHPTLLILDEPTTGVDPLARSRLWDTVRGAADRGAGVLVSTHYMEEAEHCDRVVVLVNGRVAVSDTPANIIAGRQALEVRTARWDRAFEALDRAGAIASLHGRNLRVLGADEHHIAQVLRDADVEALVVPVPATFEEAFVGLVSDADRHD